MIRPSVLAALALAVAALASMPAPASALPGRTLARFHSWAASEPAFLSNVEATKSERSGLPGFHIRNADRGIAWDLQAQTDGTIVTQEIFGLTSSSKEIGSEPIRHDRKGYGFTFFRSVYGARVASDFAASTLVATVRDVAAKETFSYYRGKNYGYVTGSSNGNLTIRTPAYFASQLAVERHCATHPADCNE